MTAAPPPCSRTPAVTGAPAVLALTPPRLLAGPADRERLDHVAHLSVHGPLPPLGLPELTDLVQAVALCGRGGAGFPFARKLRAVGAAAVRFRSGTAVVVNGSEGEPGCLKDTALLLRTPHLVLDGAELCAAALGAAQIRVGVARRDVEASLRRAAAERGPAGARTTVVRLPERFVTGESSALIGGLHGDAAVPTGSPVRTSESGLRGLPTLLSNTETFAQLAVAARLGAAGFRAVGTAAEPGTVLLTVSGERVVETPTGVPLPRVLRLCGTDLGQGVLVGGYHGRWLSPRQAAAASVSRRSLSSLGATLGAGAVLPLPHDACPVLETARVTGWLAGESAGQCGPCAFGLPALAEALALVADGGGVRALEEVRTRVAAVTGRGACSHPDGAAGFVASALAAFPDEFARHARGADCGRAGRHALPLPGAAPGARGASGPPGTERLVVDWTLCRGHGLCADTAPGLLRLDPDGFPDRRRADVPAGLRGQARRAVRRCPALALRLER